MLTLLLVGMLPLGFNVQPVKAESTKLYVNPPMVYASLGESFTVDINVADVELLHAWQVNISFNPDVLKFIDVTEGDFLQKEGRETIFFSHLDEIDEGWALFACAILEMFWVDGSGTLANVEFQVLAEGESELDLVTEPVWSEGAQKWVNVTYLIKMNPPPIPPGGKEMEEIPFTAEDGYFISVVSPPVEDATIDIDPDTLNLESKGKWITGYIELPEGYNVGDVDISTVMLNGIIEAELHPTEIGDHDSDGINDLMVKFDRQDLIATLSKGEATLTITGEVDGTSFEDSDTITVIDK